MLDLDSRLPDLMKRATASPCRNVMQGRDGRNEAQEAPVMLVACLLLKLR